MLPRSACLRYRGRFESADGGVWCGSENSFQRAIALVRDGLVDVQGLVTHEFPLAQTAEGFERAERWALDVVKAVILP